VGLQIGEEEKTSEKGEEVFPFCDCFVIQAFYGKI
jgi:hypothetical protein